MPRGTAAYHSDLLRDIMLRPVGCVVLAWGAERKDASRDQCAGPEVLLALLPLPLPLLLEAEAPVLLWP